MIICKLAQANGGSGVDSSDGVCDVFSAAGVLARNERQGHCAYQDIRATRLSQSKVKINPLKASKRG